MKSKQLTHQNVCLDRILFEQFGQFEFASSLNYAVSIKFGYKSDRQRSNFIQTFFVSFIEPLVSLTNKKLIL